MTAPYKSDQLSKETFLQMLLMMAKLNSARKFDKNSNLSHDNESSMLFECEPVRRYMVQNNHKSYSQIIESDFIKWYGSEYIEKNCVVLSLESNTIHVSSAYELFTKKKESVSVLSYSNKRPLCGEETIWYGNPIDINDFNICELTEESVLRKASGFDSGIYSLEMCPTCMKRLEKIILNKEDVS